ncbi:MAG: hypothetical protein GY853_14040 [PVC group bacterium]|nr:hypothetical protein [PVC group bacterium]
MISYAQKVRMIHKAVKKANKNRKLGEPRGIQLLSNVDMNHSFTVIALQKNKGKKVIFWYNTPDNSTHIIVEEI